MFEGGSSLSQEYLERVKSLTDEAVRSGALEDCIEKFGRFQVLSVGFKGIVFAIV